VSQALVNLHYKIAYFSFDFMLVEMLYLTSKKQNWLNFLTPSISHGRQMKQRSAGYFDF